VPFHALAKEEKVFSESLLILSSCQIHVTTETARVRDHEVGLLLDSGDVFKHSFALVWINAERANHVNEGVRVNILLVRVATQ
jgi:hypothetical protein